MLTPLILFFGLIVATAVIAYWSDNLGKKLGKKRVSLFGLRPRTTATILTISSSWAIMLFTLVVLLAVATPLRRALLSYDSDRAQYRLDIGEAKAELTATKGQLEATQNTIDQTRDQLEKARGSLERARSQVKTARDEANKAKKSAVAALQGEKQALKGANAAQQRAAAAQSRARLAQSRFQAAQARLNAAQQRYVAAQQRVLQAQARASSARRNEEQAKGKAQAAVRDLERARGNLRKTSSDLDKAKDELTKTAASLKRANEELKRVNDSAFKAGREAFKAGREVLIKERELRAVEVQVEALRAQRADLLEKLDISYRDTAQLAVGNVEIPVGRTFAAGIIESGKSQARIEENLRQLLRKGNEALTREPFLLPADARLDLLPLRQDQDEDGTISLLSGDELFSRVALEIARSEGPTSVRLVAARNILVDEIWNGRKQWDNIRIDARFQAVRVANAFHAGEVLASDLIDGTSGDAGVFSKLQTLTDSGRAEAVRRRVSPPQSPQEPYFYAAGTNVALFAALRRIEAAGKAVRVRLVAADDLSTVEPLRVRFEIDDGVPSG